LGAIKCKIWYVARLLAMIIICGYFCSCEGPSKAMASWVGHTRQEIYQSLGPPSRVTTDGGSGTILIYESYVNTGQQAGQVYNNGYGGVNYTSPQNTGYTRSRMFYVNSSGVIYSWRWQGL